MAEMPARLSVRRATFRGRPGYIVSGLDPHGRWISIFTRTRTAADRIREKVKADETLELDDFTA